MKSTPRTLAAARLPATRAAIVLSLLALALALALAVRPARGDDTKVSIPTPVGTITAKSKGAPEHVTSIPEYPGALRTLDDPDGDGAQATIKLPVISIRMQALRFNTHDSMNQVLAFYREKLAALGKVNESDEGPHTDIGEFHWTPAPGEHTLAAEADHRVYIVAMKPHGKGCQFALIGMRFDQ